MAHRGTPLLIENLPSSCTEEDIVMDLFGGSVASDCPITSVSTQRQSGTATVWIVVGGDVNGVTLDQVIQALDGSSFKGNRLKVQRATSTST